MTKQEIIEKVNKVFEESFEIEKDRLLPEANIFLDLGLDSLDIVDLMVALQKSFGVNLRNEESIRNIRTLEDIYKFILEFQGKEKGKSNP